MAAVATPPPAPVLDGATHSDQTLDAQANGHANGHANGIATTTLVEKPAVVDSLPTGDKLREVSKLPIWAADGSECSFGSIYEAPGKHMIIFIRHFLCGMCQDYVTHLSANMPPSSLPANTTLKIIGCGKPELIAGYAESTKCPYPIYADPSRALYDALGMTSNLEYGSQKPAYQTRSLGAQITRSVWQGITNLRDASKAGRPSQLGGELFLETGEKGTTEAKWCHWMKNTRGHAEVDDLKKMLAVP